MAKLIWVREDKQGSMPGGEYASAEEASAAIEAVRQEFLAQCADEASRDEIMRGSFEVLTD
jgi:hypothetical protein